MQSEPVVQFKAWMLKHEYDPEHGKNIPTNLVSTPAGSPNSPAGSANPPSNSTSVSSSPPPELF